MSDGNNMISAANELVPPDPIDVHMVEFTLNGMASNLLGHMDACEELAGHKEHCETDTERYVLALNLDHIGKSMDNLREQMNVLQALIDNQATQKDIIFRMKKVLDEIKEKDNDNN